MFVYCEIILLEVVSCKTFLVHIMAATKSTVALLCIVGFLDLMAVCIVQPLITTRIKELGGSPTLGGLISFIYGTAQLFSSVVTGSWSDVVGRRTMLLVSCLLTAATYFFMGNVGLVGISFSRLMAGVFKHTQLLSEAYLSSVVSPSNRSVYFGYFSAASNIGFIIGPAFGGHLVAMPNGFFWVSSVASIVFVFNAVLVWKCLPEVKGGTSAKKCGSADKQERKIGYWKRTKDHLIHLQLEKSWHVLLLKFTVALSKLVYMNSFNVVVSDRFGLSMKHVGYLRSYEGVVVTVAAFFVGHLSRLASTNRQVLYGVATFFVALLGLTLSPGIVSLVASLTLMSAVFAFLRVCIMQLIVSRNPKEQVGAVVGSVHSVTSTARMLSPLVSGLALEMGSQGPGVVSSMTSGTALAVSIFLVAKTERTSKEKSN